MKHTIKLQALGFVDADESDPMSASFEVEIGLEQIISVGCTSTDEQAGAVVELSGHRWSQLWVVETPDTRSQLWVVETPDTIRRLIANAK